MQQAYLNLIKFALAKPGYTISIWDSEEWSLKNSTSYKACKDEVEGVDAFCTIRIHDETGEVVGNAMTTIGYGNLPNETIGDWIISPFMDEWDKQYDWDAE